MRVVCVLGACVERRPQRPERTAFRCPYRFKTGSIPSVPLTPKLTALPVSLWGQIGRHSLCPYGTKLDSIPCVPMGCQSCIAGPGPVPIAPPFDTVQDRSLGSRAGSADSRPMRETFRGNGTPTTRSRHYVSERLRAILGSLVRTPLLGRTSLPLPS